MNVPHSINLLFCQFEGKGEEMETEFTQPQVLGPVSQDDSSRARESLSLC